MFRWEEEGGKLLLLEELPHPQPPELGSTPVQVPPTFSASVRGECWLASHSPDGAEAGFPPWFFDVRALKLFSGLLGPGQ